MNISFYNFKGDIIAKEEFTKDTLMPDDACGFIIKSAEDFLMAVYQGMRFNINEIIDKSSGLDKMLTTENYVKLCNYAKKENMANQTIDFIINMQDSKEGLELAWYPIPYQSGLEIAFSPDIEEIRQEYDNIKTEVFKLKTK